MESNVQSKYSRRRFGHRVITWEIENCGLALWQKYWEVESHLFSVRGPESQTKWKLILQTDSSGVDVSERISVKFDSENKRAIIFDSKPKEKIQTESKQTETTNLDYTQTKSVEAAKQELTKNETKRKHLGDSLLLNLERSKIDEGPSTVWVNWKVYYVGIDGEKFSVAEEERFFDKGYKYGVHIGIFFDSEREFEYNSGVVTFVCDMIVRDEYNHANFDKDISIDLCGLSEDLQWIFEQQKFCDVEIKLGKKSIFAHKAMLSLRSEYFKNVIKDLDVVELPNVSYDGMAKTLEYMYSGNLEDVIRRPSISIYDSITSINLRDLKEYYNPDLKKIRTKVFVNRLTYMWLIKDFISNESYCFSSPIICNDLEKAAWQINLYPRGADGHSEFLYLSVEYIEGNVSDGVCVQCAVLEGNETCYSWRTLEKSLGNPYEFKDEKFFNRKNLLKVLKDDALRIGFKVRMYTGKQHIFGVKMIIPRSPVDMKPSKPIMCEKKKSFETLSKCMSALQKSKEYSDVILKAAGEEINAHKFILSARSFMLSSMLEETKENYLILSVKPNVLKILLDYIYCAVLDVSDVETLLEVYDAAEEFLISRLREKCSQILQDSLALDTACEILNLADDYGNQFVKKEAMKYVILNETIFEQQAWQNLKSKKPNLCEEVERMKERLNTSDADLIMRSDECDRVVRLKDMEDEINNVIEKDTYKLLNKEDSVINLLNGKEISRATENNGTEVSKQVHEKVSEVFSSNQEEPESNKREVSTQMMYSNDIRKESFIQAEVLSEKMCCRTAKVHGQPSETCAELSDLQSIEQIKILPEPSSMLKPDLTKDTNGNVTREQPAKFEMEPTVISEKFRRVFETKILEEARGNGIDSVSLIPEIQKEKVIKAETEVISETCQVTESETPGDLNGKGLKTRVFKDPCVTELSSEKSEGDSCAKEIETVPQK